MAMAIGTGLATGWGMDKMIGVSPELFGGCDRYIRDSDIQYIPDACTCPIYVHSRYSIISVWTAKKVHCKLR